MKSPRWSILVTGLVLTAATAIASGILIAPEVKLHRALQETNEKNPTHPSIIMLGDSHTAFVNWRMLMNCPDIANFGVGGETTAQMLVRLPAVIEAAPRVVFIMAGTNDALQKIRADVTTENLKKIEDGLKAHSIVSRFLVPPPLSGHSIPTIGTVDAHITEGDLLADGIHLRRSAYAKWRDKIAPDVARFCKFSPATPVVVVTH